MNVENHEVNEEVVVIYGLDELTETVAELQTVVSETIVPSMAVQERALASINTSVTMTGIIVLAIFIYDYCKRIFKRKTVK